MKTLFEQKGGTYTQVGDYLLPDVIIPADNASYEIGVWGQRRREFLKSRHRVIYYNLLTSGKLNEHLADIDEQANGLFLRIVKELADKEGLTEKFKAENQMLWVQNMNNIRNRAMEIVNTEIIFL